MNLARAVAEHSQSSSSQPDPENAWSGALAGLGVLGNASEKTCYLWPDNVRSWNCWQGVQTQWRIGHSGATGLDYSGVRAWLTETGLEGEERREVFSAIQACERETLAVWSEHHARQAAHS